MRWTLRAVDVRKRVFVQDTKASRPYSPYTPVDQVVVEPDVPMADDSVGEVRNVQVRVAGRVVKWVLVLFFIIFPRRFVTCSDRWVIFFVALISTVDNRMYLRK